MRKMTAAELRQVKVGVAPCQRCGGWAQVIGNSDEDVVCALCLQLAELLPKYLQREGGRAWVLKLLDEVEVCK